MKRLEFGLGFLVLDVQIVHPIGVGVPRGLPTLDDHSCSGLVVLKLHFHTGVFGHRFVDEGGGLAVNSSHLSEGTNTHRLQARIFFKAQIEFFWEVINVRRRPHGSLNGGGSWGNTQLTKPLRQNFVRHWCFAFPVDHPVFKGVILDQRVGQKRSHSNRNSRSRCR